MRKRNVEQNVYGCYCIGRDGHEETRCVMIEGFTIAFAFPGSHFRINQIIIGR